jgi:hypothetical protein
MPPDPDPSANGAVQPEPRQSLREIAEAAWDEVVEDAPDDGAPDGSQSEEGVSVDSSGRQRDAAGRFKAADQPTEPGEAAPPDGTQPREDTAPQQPESPTQPPQGVSSEAPANWSAADRQAFSSLPEPAREFLLRRHSEMEGDYQRRVQANATAARFTEALSPVFTDPVIAGSLQQAGASPVDAVHQWAGFHRRAMDPNPQVRAQLLHELSERMGLNSAAIGQMSQPGAPQLSEQDLQDPAIRYFADHLGRAFNETQQLRADFQRMQHDAAQRQNAEAVKVTRWGIDSFADERGPDGKPLRPDFDEALPALIEMFHANPQLDLGKAYEEARWRTPSIRARLVTASQNTVQQRQANERARQAVRSNVRGMTTAVSKPPPGNGPQGLRASLEASADEVGF